jgi:hypothetical protein
MRQLYKWKAIADFAAEKRTKSQDINPGMPIVDIASL